MDQNEYYMVVMQRRIGDEPSLYCIHKDQLETRVKQIMGRSYRSYYSAVAYESNPCPGRDKLDVVLRWNPAKREFV